MTRARLLLLGVAILLIHSPANGQTHSVAVAASNPKAPVPPPDPQPKHELQLLEPDGFGGLKEEPPIGGGTSGGGVDPISPTIDPNSITPSD